MPLASVVSKIGTLHSDHVIETYKEAGANDLVMLILMTGVPLFLRTLKMRKYPRGHMPNNKSALSNRHFVSSTLREWESKGYIQRIPFNQAQVILPLSVAHRWSHSKQKIKYRLDCSPWKNRMAYGHIKLPDLNYLRQQIHPGDFLSLIDITSFYLHFVLDPTFAAYFCFLWTFEEGTPAYCYKPIVMLFGIPHAPWIVTAVTSVIVKAMSRNHQVNINPFIDDFSSICHGTYEDAMSQFLFLLKEIPRWGFEVNHDKVVPPAVRTMILGFYVDTRLCQIEFDTAKLTELTYLVTVALPPVMTVRQLAKIVGKMMSLGYGTRMPIGCFLPTAVGLVAAATADLDWRSWGKPVRMTEDLKEELMFVLTHLPSWNGVPLRRPNRIHYFRKDPSIVTPSTIHFVGDAGKEAAAIYSASHRNKFYVEYFSEDLQETSSARRELASLEILFLHYPDLLERNSNVVYTSDNLTLNRWVNVGTCKPGIAKILQKIFLKASELEITLAVTWEPRLDFKIQAADLAGRRDSDEFGLRLRDYNFIMQHFGMEVKIDAFASEFFFVVPKFYSKIPSPRSSGSNGLLSQWNDVMYLFPPRKLLGGAIQRIQSERNLKAILVVMDNLEDLVGKNLLENGHGPSYVFKILRFPVKIRMTSSVNPTPVHNSFANSWHMSLILCIDKTRASSPLEDRCLQAVGKCKHCDGNPLVRFERIKYGH